MTQRKSHSDGGLLVAKLGKRFLVYTVIPGLGNCRPASPELIDYSRHAVIRKMNVGDDKPDERSWRKAYGLALSLLPWR